MDNFLCGYVFYVLNKCLYVDVLAFIRAIYDFANSIN